MILRDKLGWPVVRIKNQWFANIIRILVYVDVVQTLKLRKHQTSNFGVIIHDLNTKDKYHPDDCRSFRVDVCVKDTLFSKLN